MPAMAVPAVGRQEADRPEAEMVRAELIPPAVASADASGEEFQFSLTTIFLLITVAAGVLAAWSYSRGIGILALILVLPSLLFTAVRNQSRRQSGEYVSPAETVGSILGSILLMGLICAGLAAIFTVLLVVTFLAACAKMLNGI